MPLSPHSRYIKDKTLKYTANQGESRSKSNSNEEVVLISRAPEHESHYQMQLVFILRTLARELYPSTEEQSVFSTAPNWKDIAYFKLTQNSTQSKNKVWIDFGRA